MTSYITQLHFESFQFIEDILLYIHTRIDCIKSINSVRAKWYEYVRNLYVHFEDFDSAELLLILVRKSRGNWIWIVQMRF